MNIFKRQSRMAQDNDDNDDDSDEPQVLPDGVCFRWYFMTVGYAMGYQVYTSICKFAEFQIVGGGRGLSPGKLGVRYYVGTRQDRPEGQFSGFELESGGAQKPVGKLSEAHGALGGGGDQQAIIAILSDSRFDNMNARFRDYLNQKYIEVGALPIVRLLYTDSGEDAKRLLALFTFKEENTPILARKKPGDFFTPAPHSQPEKTSEVTFSCSNCTQHLAVHESYRGEQVPCPTCGEHVTVPPVAAPPPLPVAPPSRPASPPPVRSSGLRDSIIRAQTSDQKARLIIQRRDEIRRAFPEWLTIPDEHLKTEAGRKSYSETLIVIAVIFAQNFGDSSLLKLMKPPEAGDKKPKWKFW